MLVAFIKGTELMDWESLLECKEINFEWLFFVVQDNEQYKAVDT
jgi:hypothetical protein